MRSPGDRTAPKDLGRLLGWLLGATTLLLPLVVAGLLALSWVAIFAVGGAGKVAPHVFYVPILVASARLGWIGAAVTGIAAGIVAGPLLPLDVAAGTSQSVSDWVSRTAFFVAIGLTVSWIFAATRRIEARLRESRRTLATLLANLPGLAYRGRAVPERTMEFVSRGSLMLTGHPPSDLTGEDALPYGDLIHPADRAEAWGAVRRALAEGRPFQITYRLRGVDGEERWIREQGRGVGTSNGMPGVIEGFATDVTNEKRAQAQREQGVRALTALLEERRRLVAMLVSAQEDERRRIAGDLHDDPLQAMAALGMRLGILARELKGHVGAERLRDLEAALTESMRRLRALMFELYPPELDRDGLVETLRLTLDRLRADLGIEYALEGELEEEPTADIRAIAFRIVQEALANVRKHAGASRVVVTVASDESGVRVRVQDDGAGFEAERIATGIPGHLGLPTMRERAQLVGGRCSIDSTPGAGTVVDVWLPVGASLSQPSGLRP